MVEPEVGTSICLHDPGFGIDIVVRTDVATLSRLWYGRETFDAALRAGRIRFEGPSALTRQMSRVLTIAHPPVWGASGHAPRPRAYVA